MASGLAIVTGSNTGLGLHLVKALYASGTYGSIVLACRNREKAERAIETIRANAVAATSSSNANTKLQFIQLDLTSRTSIRCFVDQLGQHHQHGTLRLLVNNAGLMGHPHQLVDGVEIHFASNHLGHFMLTNLLIDYLAPNARILIVTSGFYEKCHKFYSLDDLTSDKPPCRPIELYSFSKLANCLHTLALSKRLPEGIKVVAVRPGFVRGTELGRHTHLILQMLAYPLIWMVAKNLDQGISTMLHCAHCPDSDLQSGALYHDSHAVPYNNPLVNQEMADQLWQISELLTNR